MAIIQEAKKGSFGSISKPLSIQIKDALQEHEINLGENLNKPFQRKVDAFIERLINTTAVDEKEGKNVKNEKEKKN